MEGQRHVWALRSPRSPKRPRAAVPGLHTPRKRHSRGPAPPSWPEGIDPEELERQRQRFQQLRKFERVHKQLHTHSNGGTKRKIQGKGTDTGVTRLLRNRSLVASHCPFCTQLRIANTTGQNNAAAKACACSGAEARGSTTFHFTLDRPVNNEPLKCAGLNGGEAVRKGRCPLNPAPPGALAGAKARQSCSNGGETVRKGRCPLNPALPGAFRSQRPDPPSPLLPPSSSRSIIALQREQGGRCPP